MEVIKASNDPTLLRRLIPSLFIIFVLSTGIAGVQHALAQGPVQSVMKPSADPLHLDWYIAARYSIFGPAELKSVTSESLVFSGEFGKPGFTVSLSKKKVSVMNEAGAALPTSSLSSGANVVVCYRNDSVVIFLVQPTSAGVGHVK